MGLYILLDIESTQGGDLKLTDSGDLKVGSTEDSQLSVINFWLRTDHGGYAPARDVGANLGSFIGENNTEEIMSEMRDQTFDTLVRNFVYPEDLQVEVVPFTYDEVLVAVETKGNYMNDDGDFVAAAPRILTYLFPFIDGEVFPT